MNVLLIEDERELAATARMQIEGLGHSVEVVYDLAEARARMDDPGQRINMVIADHRLPDGLGIDWVIEMRESYPECEYAIVSGCLTNEDVECLQQRGLPYFHKPLLYSRVIERLRRSISARKPVHEVPAAAPPAGGASEGNDAPDGNGGVVRAAKNFLGRLPGRLRGER